MAQLDELHLDHIDHRMLQRQIRLNLKNGGSFFVRGGVGIGKTYSVGQYAAEEARRTKRKLLVWVDLDHETRLKLAHDEEFRRDSFVLAIFDTLNKLPEDTCGIPVPVNGFVEWKPPMLFYVLAQPGAAGVLFLDELLQAQQAVQKPLSELFLNKQIGDHRLQPDVGIIGASNEQIDKCGTIEMLPHLENRMGHAVLRPPTADEWCSWMQQQDKQDENDNIVAPRIDPRIIMMIKSCPELLYQPRNRVGSAYPTPRSWDILSTLIKDVDHEKDKEFFLCTVATRVGMAAAAKFQDVLNHDMQELGPQMLQDPEQYRAAPWDRKIAFAMWLSGHSRNNQQFMQQACAFLDRLGADSMLDTLLYLMKNAAGAPFVRELTGTLRYPAARAALLDMATNLRTPA